MRGEEDKLHAAYKIGDRHHRKGRVLQCAQGHHHGTALGIARDLRWQGQGIDFAGKPCSRNDDQGHHDEAGYSDPPAEFLRQRLTDRCSDQCANRARCRDHAKHRAADGGGNRACSHCHGDGRTVAGHRRTDRETGAERHAKHSLRGRQQHHAQDIEQRTCNHERAIADPNGQCACEGLQKAPHQVLHGDGKRELRNRYPHVFCESGHENAQALTQSQAHGEHQRCADQDRQDRAQGAKV